MPAKLICAAAERGPPSRIAPSQPHGQRHERAFASCLRRVQLYAEDALRPRTEVGKDGTRPRFDHRQVPAFGDAAAA